MFIDTIPVAKKQVILNFPDITFDIDRVWEKWQVEMQL